MDLEQAFLAITGVPNQARPLTMLINFATFCGLSPDQAHRVLRRRAAAGTLAHQAVNKGRFYTLAAKPGH